MLLLLQRWIYPITTIVVYISAGESVRETMLWGSPLLWRPVFSRLARVHTECFSWTTYECARRCFDSRGQKTLIVPQHRPTGYRYTLTTTNTRASPAPAGGKRLRRRRQRVIRRTYLCTSCGICNGKKKISRVLWHSTVFVPRRIPRFLLAGQYYYYTSTNKTRLMFMHWSQYLLFYKG